MKNSGRNSVRSFAPTLAGSRRLSALLAVLLLAWGGVECSPGGGANVRTQERKKMDGQFEFEVLKTLRGGAYDAARENWRRSQVPDRAWLAAREQWADWETAVTARILLGWSEHGRMYDDLLSQLDAENVEAAGRTVAGLNLIWDKYQHLAATKYKTDILPLCWEVILKHSSDWPQWKLITFLRMMRGVPHEKSLEPLLWYIQNAEYDATIYSASQALAQLPKSIVAPKLERAKSVNARARQRLENTSEELNRQPPKP